MCFIYIYLYIYMFVCTRDGRYLKFACTIIILLIIVITLIIIEKNKVSKYKLMI